MNVIEVRYQFFVYKTGSSITFKSYYNTMLNDAFNVANQDVTLLMVFIEVFLCTILQLFYAETNPIAFCFNINDFYCDWIINWI